MSEVLPIVRNGRLGTRSPRLSLNCLLALTLSFMLEPHHIQLATTDYHLLCKALLSTLLTDTLEVFYQFF